MDDADLSKTAKARHFVAFDIPVVARRRNIYGRYFVSKNPHGAGLQYEFVCGKKVLPQGGGVQVGQRCLSAKSVATR